MNLTIGGKYVHIRRKGIVYEIRSFGQVLTETGWHSSVNFVDKDNDIILLTCTFNAFMTTFRYYGDLKDLSKQNGRKL